MGNTMHFMLVNSLKGGTTPIFLIFFGSWNDFFKHKYMKASIHTFSQRAPDILFKDFDDIFLG